MLSVCSLPGALWCPWEGRAKVCADIIRTTFIMSAVGSPLAHTGSTDSLCAYFALCSVFQLKKHIGGWCWFPFFILQFSDPVVLSKQYELCPLTLAAPSEIPQYFFINYSHAVRLLYFFCQPSPQERFVNFISIFSGLKFFFWRQHRLCRVAGCVLGVWIIQIKFILGIHKLCLTASLDENKH